MANIFMRTSSSSYACVETFNNQNIKPCVSVTCTIVQEGQQVLTDLWSWQAVLIVDCQRLGLCLCDELTYQDRPALM